MARGARRRRPDERAVRGPGRRRRRGRLRARGQPARVAHGAVRLEGDRRSRSPRSRRAAWSGRRSPSSRASRGEIVPPYFSVKEAVFPFIKFPGVDTILGPEMRSTGEVMGIGRDVRRGVAEEPARRRRRACRRAARVCITVRERATSRARSRSRATCIDARLPARRDARHGGGARRGAASPVTRRQQGQGRPAAHRRHDEERRDRSSSFNTVDETRTAIADTRHIRRAALADRVTYYTSMAGCEAAVEGMKRMRDAACVTLQELHELR